MKVLVAGWFSFADGHATAGDLLSRDIVCDWLAQLQWQYDVALSAPFEGGVDWRKVDPKDYSHVLFVCGPFQRTGHECDFLNRFAESRLLGINLSMLESESAWQPFDLLLERDSSERVNPDLVFLSPAKSVPVVGLCAVESYPGALASEANDALERLAQSQQAAVISISTRLDIESHNPLRTPHEIESLIAKTDVLLTSRLHGLVLALKNGVPAIAIDPEPGGAKIRRQAELLGWPLTFVADALDDQALQDAFQRALTENCRVEARECVSRARALLSQMPKLFAEELCGNGSMEARYQSRVNKRVVYTSSDNNADGTSSLWKRHKVRWTKVRKRLPGFKA